MGINATASLGYGFKISNQNIIDKINEDEEDFRGKAFEFIFHGADDNTVMLLCIKQSITSIFCWNKPKSITTNKLPIDNEWDEKLLNWCKKYNIKDPKIGWWLCSTMG